MTTKTKVDQKAQAGEERDLSGLLEGLKALASQVPQDLHRTLDPVLKRLETGIEVADLVALVSDRNGVIEELREILYRELVLITEEDGCPICNRSQGEPHGRGGCAARARIEEARARVDRA